MKQARRSNVAAATIAALGLAATVALSAQAPSSAARRAQQQSDALSALRFRSVGPAFTSGRMADVAVDPNNKHVWYVASASGGLWKTTNRGLEFTPIFDDYETYTMCCVLVDPRNSNVVWLATGENTNLRSAMAGAGIYKSTDAGATWSNVGLTRSEKIGTMVMDPRDSNVVYVAAQGPLWADGGERGLYKTTDGGQTWSRVLHVSEYTGISDIVLDPRNPDVLYASSYQRRRNPGILIGGGPEGAIYKSEDAGVTWRELTNGLPQGDMGRIALAISPQNPDVVYASIAAKDPETGFYRSADRGETWVRMSDWIAGDPQYYGEIYPDPFQFDKVWGVAVRIAVTEDGGRTFEEFQTSGVHVDHHYMGFDADDPRYMMLGNDGGLYESYDGGETWKHFRNLPVVQYYRIAVDSARPFYNVYGGTQDNGSPGTPSASVHPSGIRESEAVSVGGGDGFQPRVDPRDPDLMYTMSQNANLTRFNRRTGERVSIRPPTEENGEEVRWHWDVPLMISPHSPDRIYILGSRLYRSDNRGDDWRAVSPDLTKRIDRDTLTIMGRQWPADAVWKNVFTNDISIGMALDESPLVEGLLYVGTDDGLIQVSEDGGGAWRRIDSFPGVPAGTYVSDVLASRHDPNVVFAAFNGWKKGDFTPYVLRSTDRGRTWASIRGNLPDGHYVWTLMQDPENADLLFAGTEIGLYVSLDGGASWERMRTGLPTIPVRDVELQLRERDLVLGTFGRGIYILDDYSPLRALAAARRAAQPTLFAPQAAKLFPPSSVERGATGNGLFVGENPEYGALLTYHLPAALPAGSELIVTVSDAQGSVTRVEGPGAAGTHRVVWDLRRDPPAAADEGGRGGRGGGGRGGRGGRGGGAQGPLVEPGVYTIQLNRMQAGTLSPLGDPRRLDVMTLAAWTTAR